MYLKNILNYNDLNQFNPALLNSDIVGLFLSAYFNRPMVHGSDSKKKGKYLSLEKRI